MSGTVHYNIQLVIDEAGGIHWKYQANHNLSGHDINGNKYQVISNVMQYKNSKDGGFPYE